MSAFCNSVPTLSAPPVLSERGQRALVRPPLLCCSLFECQYSTLNTSGLINLGVAENVSRPSSLGRAPAGEVTRRGAASPPRAVS